MSKIWRLRLADQVRAADQQTIDILRLLHDSMDLVRHLPLSEDRP
jgi:plasmid stabilization system protein ParE